MIRRKILGFYLFYLFWEGKKSYLFLGRLRVVFDLLDWVRGIYGGIVYFKVIDKNIFIV